MNELRKLSITQMHEGLNKKDFSSVELIEAHINAVENEKLNAFITKTPEIAMKAAKAADENFSKRENSPLMGIPVGVKDLFCTAGIKTTAASKMLENFIPTYEST
ncbi:Amidase signature domain, partial [Cinara cedri]